MTIANAGTATGVGVAGTESFLVRKTSSAQSLSHNTNTLITFNTVDINTNTNWNEDSLYDMNTEISYMPVEDVRSYKVNSRVERSSQKKVSAGNRSKALQVKKSKKSKRRL